MRSNRLNAKRLIRLLLVTAIVLLALFLRLRAVELPPIDYEEDDYLRAAQQFATAIQAGDWGAFTRLNYRTKHPPLSKIVILALMLGKRGNRFRGMWQVIFILPWAIPEFVGILTWLHIFEPTNGWLALALGTPVLQRYDSLLALSSC